MIKRSPNGSFVEGLKSGCGWISVPQYCHKSLNVALLRIVHMYITFFKHNDALPFTTKKKMGSRGIRSISWNSRMVITAEQRTLLSIHSQQAVPVSDFVYPFGTG